MTGSLKWDAPSRGGAPREVRSRRMHPRTLAAASRMTFLVVAAFQIPIAALRLPTEYPHLFHIGARWLWRLGCTCVIAGSLTLLAVAIWGLCTASIQRNSGVRLATAAIVGGAMAILGELLEAAAWMVDLRDWATAMAPATLLTDIAVNAHYASGSIACTVLAVAWRRSMGRRAA